MGVVFLHVLPTDMHKVFYFFFNFLLVCSSCSHQSTPLWSASRVTLQLFQPWRAERVVFFHAVHADVQSCPPFTLVWLKLSSSSLMFCWYIVVVPFTKMLEIIQGELFPIRRAHRCVLSCPFSLWSFTDVYCLAPVLSGVLGVIMAFLHSPACSWNYFSFCSARWHS